MIHRELTIENPLYRKWVQQFTVEEMGKDVGLCDITTNVVFHGQKRVRGFVMAKQNGILAGRQEIEFFLRRFPKIHFCFLKRDGAALRKGQRILELNGEVHDLMKIERVILNLIGRMSGVATLTKRIVEKAKRANPKIIISPTRKTLWGLLDKRACVLGGADPHRLGLYDAMLIKHNHIRASGKSFENFMLGVMLSLSRHGVGKAKFFEIEISNSEDAFIVTKLLSQRCEFFPARERIRVMFDNMRSSTVRNALGKIRRAGFDQGILFEASGGINEKNLNAYARSGVDILSLGMLTHSAPMLDVSMRIV